jgi:hypothetical protein
MLEATSNATDTASFSPGDGSPGKPGHYVSIRGTGPGHHSGHAGQLTVHIPDRTIASGGQDDRFSFEDHKLAGAVIEAHGANHAGTRDTVIIQQAGNHNTVKDIDPQPLAFLFENRLEGGTPDPEDYIIAMILGIGITFQSFAFVFLWWRGIAVNNSVAGREH